MTTRSYPIRDVIAMGPCVRMLPPVTDRNPIVLHLIKDVLSRCSKIERLNISISCPG